MRSGQVPLSVGAQIHFQLNKYKDQFGTYQYVGNSYQYKNLKYEKSKFENNKNICGMFAYTTGSGLL